MKQLIRTCLALGALALGVFAVADVQASVVIASTRVIYDAKERETTVKLSNNGTTPALTQTWIDKGDPRATPATIDVPFTVTPPVARIDAGKAQTLRILYTGEPMRQDRESVFWLNVLEVPPKPTSEDSETNKIQLAFRSRIKLFFRPVGLKGNADEAPAQIRWRLVREADRPAIEGRNPSLFHVSFTEVQLTGGGKTAHNIEGGMIAPGETRSFPLTGEVPQGTSTTVKYQYINDYGGAVAGESTVSTSAGSPPSSAR